MNTTLTQRPQYAGFWIRVAASLIDTGIFLIVAVPLLVSIYGWDYIGRSARLTSGPADFLISYVMPAVAVILFWIYRQATPGKMLLSLKVVNAADLGPPSTGQCVGRYFSYFLSTIPLCLGLLWVGLDSRKQGWHDKLAGTLVVRHDHRPG